MRSCHGAAPGMHMYMHMYAQGSEDAHWHMFSAPAASHGGGHRIARWRRRRHRSALARRIAPGRRSHLRPVVAVEVESEEVVERAAAVVPAKDIHVGGGRVHDGGGGGARARAAPGDTDRHPLLRAERVLEQIVEVVPPVAAAEDEHLVGVDDSGVAAARRGRGAAKGDDGPGGRLEVEAVEVVEVPLRVVPAEHVHPLVMHDGRVRVPRARAARAQIEIKLPGAGLEVEYEQVVAVHAAVVATEHVQRAAVHHRRREDARARRARHEADGHPRHGSRAGGG